MKKKALIVILSLIVTVACVLMSGCQGVVYDFAVTEKWKDLTASDTDLYAEAVLHAFGQNPASDNHGYDGETYLLKEESAIEFAVEIPVAGKYAVYVDYYIEHNGLTDSETALQINGVTVCERSPLKAMWKNETETFAKDSFGNELCPTQVKNEAWAETYLDNFDLSSPVAPVYEFKQGENIIGLNVISGGEFLLGKVKVRSVALPLSYDEYISSFSGSKQAGEGLSVAEAEHPYLKNNTAAVSAYSADVNVTPYETYTMPLNTVSNFSETSEIVYYKLNAQKTGLYNLSFNYSNANANRTVYVSVAVDGSYPFGELIHYPFINTSGYASETLGKDGKAFSFMLTRGEHIVSVKIDGSLLSGDIARLDAAIGELNEIYIDLKKIAGTVQDTDREWNPDTDFPGVVEKLTEISTALKEIKNNLIKTNGANINYQGVIYLEAAEKSINGMLEKPMKIPNNYAKLSEGSGSVVQTVANAKSDLTETPLGIDKIVLAPEGGGQSIERKSGFFAFWENVKKFFHSFTADYSNVSDDKKTLQVWVARSRQYTDLMQQLIDSSDFYERTGYKVKFTILADEGKLILSNAAGLAPNAVMGISNWLPYEMGIRDLTVDLTHFPDYGDTLKRFSPGAMIPLIADGRGLALPETQDFYVMYYRKDILTRYNIDIPDTWEDVISILPELQRYGLNFYIPLSSSTSSKSIMTTAPFIYQYGGTLFGDDATSTTIDDENSLNAIKMMTELFTLYGLQEQTNNFFDSFRNGSLPIGVSTFDTYVKLSVAAPEITGKWSVALSPGKYNSVSGEVERWQTGSSSSVTLMKSGDEDVDAAGWELLKWWTSQNTQTEFMNRLTMLYGKGYIWNSANLDAFGNSVAFSAHDKKVILDQWEWMREIPKVPGWYMLERELSNAWNLIVLEAQNTRSVVENAVSNINKELQRKLTEFGYMKNGVMVKPYKLTTLDDVKKLRGDFD